MDESNKIIGNTNFEIARYYRRSSGKTVMYGYNWGGNFVTAENSEGVELSDNCLDQVDEVIRLSETRGFKQ